MADHLTSTQLHEDQGPALIVFFTIFTALPVVVVSTRVISRHVARTPLWWDDWLLIAACVIEIVQFVFLIEGIRNGEGRHIQTVTPEQLKWYLIWTYASEIYYGVVVTLVKCSFLCLYLRLFGINRNLVRICYAMLVFVIGWGISTSFTTIFQCIPVDAAWDLGVQRASCINLRLWLIINNVPNILADVIIILLPVPLVWSLKLSLARKVALTIIFLLAFATTTVSCLRVNVTANINLADPTWGYVATAKFSTVEANLGIITACLPVLAPLIRRCIGRRPIKYSQEEASYGLRTIGSSGHSRRRPAHELGALQHITDEDGLAGPRNSTVAGLPDGRAPQAENVVVA